LKDFSKISNFALLDFKKTESYLTFFQGALPVFNRYLTIPKKGESLDLDKFIESVNLSFQYFKREFKAYQIDKVIVVSDSEGAKLVSTLEEGLHAEAEIASVSALDLTGNENASVESAKALGAANRDLYPGFRPVLRKTEVAIEEGEVPAEIPALKIGLLAGLVGVGLIALTAFFMLNENQVTEKKNELRLFEQGIEVPEELENLSWKERADKVNEKAARVKIFKEAKAAFKQLFGFFDSLGKVKTRPDGVWLDSVTISQRDDDYTGNLTGYVFQDDDYAERLALDEFISILKEDGEVRSVFPNVEIETSLRKKLRKFDVTNFSIKLK
jgi:hypothetical protein